MKYRLSLSIAPTIAGLFTGLSISNMLLWEQKPMFMIIICPLMAIYATLSWRSYYTEGPPAELLRSFYDE